MKLHVLASAAFMLATSAFCADPGPMRSTSIAGEWGRPDDAFPPVNLTLADGGSALHARLRLSGADARGTASVDGTRITLHLEGRPEITGELISSMELRLLLGPDGTSYTLRRMAPMSPR